MLSIGAKVRIKSINKNDCGPKPMVLKDDDGYVYMEPEGTYIGKFGEVTRREFGTGKMPCGESPTDPLYIVKTAVGTDAFWREELELVP